jgi:hypothetical protein
MNCPGAAHLGHKRGRETTEVEDCKELERRRNPVITVADSAGRLPRPYETGLAISASVEDCEEPQATRHPPEYRRPCMPFGIPGSQEAATLRSQSPTSLTLAISALGGECREQLVMRWFQLRTLDARLATVGDLRGLLENAILLPGNLSS